MVSNYTMGQQYQVGKLKDFIYTCVDASFDISIDNGDCKVKDLRVWNLKKHSVASARMTSTETMAGRFKFENVVEAVFDEKKEASRLKEIEELKTPQWVIVEDENGFQYMMSVDFKSSMKYKYSLTDGDNTLNSCTVTLSASSNHPVMAIEDNIGLEGAEEASECGYSITGGVMQLALASTGDITITVSEEDETEMEKITEGTSGALKLIEYNDKSFSFTSDFDGKSYTHTLTFSVPMEKEQYNWHYNLLEFKKNRYAAFMKTNGGHRFCAGWDIGLFPSFVLQTGESAEEGNKITVTLVSTSNKPICHMYDETPIEEDANRFLSPVRLSRGDEEGIGADTWTCYGNQTAIITLCRIVNGNGYPTGEYMCLEGHQADFPSLNVIGTYTASEDMGVDLFFTDLSCSVQSDCGFSMFPDPVAFTEAGQSFNLTVKSNCDWEITDAPSWLDVQPLSGYAGMEQTVAFSSNDSYPSQSGTVFVHFATADNVAGLKVTWDNPEGTDWITPKEKSITAQSQTVDFSVQGVVTSVNSANLSWERVGNILRFSVSENATGSPRTFTVPVYRDGQQTTVRITQDKSYGEWREDSSNYYCDGADKYTRMIWWKGWTADSSAWFATGTFKGGSLIEENSSSCIGSTEEWRDTGSTMCSMGNKYSEQRKWLITPTSETPTDEYRKGSLIEEASSDCEQPVEYIYEWRAVLDGYYCDGYDKYVKEQRWQSADGGVTWTAVEPEEYRRSDSIIESNSADCGYVPIEPQYRWAEVEGEYICE